MDPVGQGDINVWGLVPPAAQSGVSRPSQRIYRRSPVGATYDEARGYFRPQADCIMFTRDNVPFCLVCRSAIEQILDLHTDSK